MKKRDLVSAFLGAIVGVWLTLRIANAKDLSAWQVVAMLVMASVLILLLERYTKPRSFKSRWKSAAFVFVGSLFMAVASMFILDPHEEMIVAFSSADFVVFASFPLCTILLMEACAMSENKLSKSNGK